MRMVEEERRRQMQELDIALVLSQGAVLIMWLTIQDRAVERVQTDFQHFIALIERVS